MKSKKNQNRYHRKKEFRFKDIVTKTKSGKSKIIKHPAYIFLESGELFIYVTLTHSKEIKNVVLIELRKNPNPNDNKKSYYVAETKEDYKINFGNRILNWKMTAEDDKEIRGLINKKDDSAAWTKVQLLVAGGLSSFESSLYLYLNKKINLFQQKKIAPPDSK